MGCPARFLRGLLGPDVGCVGRWPAAVQLLRRFQHGWHDCVAARPGIWKPEPVCIRQCGYEYGTWVLVWCECAHYGRLGSGADGEYLSAGCRHVRPHGLIRLRVRRELPARQGHFGHGNSLRGQESSGGWQATAQRPGPIHGARGQLLQRSTALPAPLSHAVDGY